MLSFESNQPVYTERNDKLVSFNRTCSELSDSNGKFIMASNGMKIVDKNMDDIQNGEIINYNNFWKIWDLSSHQNGYYAGLTLSQGMISLPWPDRDSILYLAYNFQIDDFGTNYVKGLFMGIIDNSNDKLKVVIKDKQLITDSLNFSAIQACRHANGRDWWVMMPSHNHDKYYTFLFDPLGIKLYRINNVLTKFTLGGGQAWFTPDGRKYAIYQGEDGFWSKGKLSIYDFDRSTGELSNMIHKEFSTVTLAPGMAISYDSRFLYYATGDEIRVLDLNANDIFASEKTIAIVEDFVHEGDSIKYNNFSFLGLAPDGRIYISAGYTDFMHKIEYPDEGENSIVNQHSLFTNLNGMSIPNFPNFRLGPLDGSPADTLGLDNHPIAKYRYEGDTTDHLNVRFTDLSYFRPETWHWDFGDGTTFDGKKPYWHSFPKNGVYNVCLTVSNENSSNTTCRQVNIGPTSNEELLMKNEKLISLFPNPTEGEVLLTVSDYIPQHGEVYVYDMMGKQVHKQRVYYGWNNIDLSHLAKGHYVYKVVDNGSEIGSGKLVKL